MVKLSSLSMGQMRTFGFRMKNRRNWNHRVPIEYQRFMDNIDVEKIVSHYSRDDYDKINPREGDRTYKMAQETVGKKHYLLPTLSQHDLEANKIFEKELDRQRGIVARINKIRVVVDSVPGRGTELSMNKDLSTPLDCAKHISHLHTTRAVVAEIAPLGESDQSSSERKIYWDMHRPLEQDCSLKFRHFTDGDVSEVNKIYWRSCSFVLGMAVRLAFRDEIKVLPHSWPKPNIKSGSFVYDVALNLDHKWEPNEQELRAFTKVMWEIKQAAMPFDRLSVSGDVAREMFARNPFKLAQIDSILEDGAASRSDNQTSQSGRVTVYRCGGLLDMSIGPMISNTSQIGRISLAAVHPFDSDNEQYKGLFYRFQGVSLPQQLPVSSFIYQNVLINQAKNLNKASL